MNISKQTLELLNEHFYFTFYDRFMNEVAMDKANELHIGFTKDGSEYIGKSIKATKKEMTFNYIMSKINSDKTFQNFSSEFNKIISKYGLSAYPTSYGIGIFVAFGFRKSINETKERIEKALNEIGVKFTTEHSDAGWVFRYKISKSKENISILQNFITSNN